ncbi:uncharacterized protein LOC133917939 [Phragmites australis]|uniref:uncharacterized protein LOC133917939 n=1 Tax=Phragmites australis TaxID=29695 RepID=UPI002D76835D|nr:uncharacterized protein LOC133917939 [Phragmites australis]
MAASPTSSSSSAPTPSPRQLPRPPKGPLWEKCNCILQMEESLAASIDELECLRTPLATTLVEELSSRPAPAPAVAASSSFSNNSNSSIQDLLSLVYFGSLFVMKSQSEFIATCDKGKQRGDDEDNEEEDAIGGEGLRASEMFRKEMGLKWMLKTTSSSRAKGSDVQSADNEKKDEAAHEEDRSKSSNFSTVEVMDK